MLWKNEKVLNWGTIVANLGRVRFLLGCITVVMGKWKGIKQGYIFVANLGLTTYFFQLDSSLAASAL